MKGPHPDNPTIWQTGRPDIQSQPDSRSKVAWIIHSECFPVYGEMSESGGGKITVHLSRLHKAAEWSQQQRDTHSRAAELKYTALGNELSKFRVHIAWNYTKAQGLWVALVERKKGAFPRLFLLYWQEILPVERRRSRSCLGKMVLGLGERRREQ